MTLNIMNALEAKNNFGHLLDEAQAHPVQINKHGRPIAYVISTAEFQRLQNLHDTSIAEAILKASKEEAEDSDYQNELTQWDTTLSDGLKNKN